MFELTLLIPCSANDGATFTPEHHAVFEAHVLSAFGGFTLVPSTVIGAWSSGETRFDDVLRVYVIALRSITDGAKVADLAAFAKAHYAQEAVYVRYLGLSEIL
jgi:hypothetical protein